MKKSTDTKSRTWWTARSAAPRPARPHAASGLRAPAGWPRRRRRLPPSTSRWRGAPQASAATHAQLLVAAPAHPLRLVAAAARLQLHNQRRVSASRTRSRHTPPVAPRRCRKRRHLPPHCAPSAARNTAASRPVAAAAVVVDDDDAAEQQQKQQQQRQQQAARPRDALPRRAAPRSRRRRPHHHTRPPQSTSRAPRKAWAPRPAASHSDTAQPHKRKKSECFAPRARVLPNKRLHRSFPVPPIPLPAVAARAKSPLAAHSLLSLREG